MDGRINVQTNELLDTHVGKQTDERKMDRRTGEPTDRQTDGPNEPIDQQRERAGGLTIFFN